MAASQERSTPANDLDTEIDRVLRRAVRKIEAEKKALEYLCINPEAGWTKTEQALLVPQTGGTADANMHATCRSSSKPVDLGAYWRSRYGRLVAR